MTRRERAAARASTATPAATPPATSIATPVAAALDAAAITVFVAVGRRTHDQDPGLSGLAYTLAPFLIALAAGWVIARAWNRPLALTTGVVVWAVTIVGGMLLRNLVFDRGTATSFIVVATLFTGACLIGWRLVAIPIRSGDGLARPR